MTYIHDIHVVRNDVGNNIFIYVATYIHTCIMYGAIEQELRLRKMKNITFFKV